MTKQKLVLHVIKPFILEGVIDEFTNTDFGARENARILYEVLCRNVTASTFMAFMELLKKRPFEKNKDLQTPLNPSKRKYKGDFVE